MKNFQKNYFFIATLFYCLAVTGSIAKSMPSEFDDLIADSDLVVLVNVVEIKSGGKGKPGKAVARIKQEIIGKSYLPNIEIHWQGYGITTIGEWLLYLKHHPGKQRNVYNATYGARSFWRIEYVQEKNKECCSRFTVLRYPVKNLVFTDGLVEQQDLITALNDRKKTIPAEGILLKKVIGYIEKKKRTD